MVRLIIIWVSVKLGMSVFLYLFLGVVGMECYDAVEPFDVDNSRVFRCGLYSLDVLECGCFFSGY